MKKRTFKPVGVNLTVKIKKIEEMSEGGILLMDKTKGLEAMAREEGTILAIASNSGFQEDGLKVGDLIAFARYGGKQLGFDEDKNEIRVMKDVDVLAIIVEEDE